MVRGWSSVSLVYCDPESAEEDSEMGDSAGIGRVVTIWVTALEKNFSSCWGDVSLFSAGVYGRTQSRSATIYRYEEHV